MEIVSIDKERRTRRFWEWDTPASSYQEEQTGNYRIGKHVYRRGLYSYHGMDGCAYFTAKNPLTLTTLREFRENEWHTWMVDSPPDYRAMEKYAEKAYGHVLTTGLGLVTHELCKNDRVESITIIERSQSVIKLVQKHLPKDNRIEVVCEDFWKFIEQNDPKWDTLIVDLWVFTGHERQIQIYEEEIIPANKVLRAKYPEAQIIFHAFAGMPTMEEVNRVQRMGGNTDPLIYGLGGK